MAKATKTSGIAGLLGAAKKSTTATKSTTPQVEVPDNLAGALHDFCEASREFSLAESRKKDAAAQLLDFGNEQRVKLSRESGEALSSLKVYSKGDKATFITQSRFTGMKAEEGVIETLQDAFGNDYDKYFTVAPQIKISDSLTDEQAQKLTDALQKAGLMSLVEVNPVVKPNERFAQDMVLDAKIAAIATRMQGEGLCKPVQYFRV